MPGTTGFRLDDEQRARVRDCLSRAQISLSQDQFVRFVRDIEASIDHFRTAPFEATFREREVHDGLRALWTRCHFDEPPVQVLREELRKLPKRAVEYMGRRARVVIPRLFPGEAIEEGVFDPPDRLAARLLAWAASADDQKLVAALRVLAAEGAQNVDGRSRGSGKRSARRIEPSILGEVRGIAGKKLKGGRPSEDARHELVTHLAVDWLHATGKMPDPGRSDKTGFGDLVHALLEWLYVPNSGSQATIDLAIEAAAEVASYALRRFWAEAKKIKARSSASAASSGFCVDCRWILRDGDDPDNFFCRRLNLACATARKTAEACGPEGKLFEPPA